MFPKYFGVPHAVIRSGLWAEMKPSERSLYVCLLHDSERYRTREMTRTDAELCKLTGLSSRALCDARKKLQERGLVLCERGRGNVYKYTICNPETRQPWPGDPKVVIRYRKQGDSEPESSVPAVATVGKPFAPEPERPVESYGVPLKW